MKPSFLSIGSKLLSAFLLLALAFGTQRYTPVNAAPHNACSAAITVYYPLESGPGSLRQAIADICPGGTITFGNSFTAGLASALLVNKDLTIDGAGRTINLINYSTNVITLSSGTLNLNHLAITGVSEEATGGAIFVAGGTLNVTNSVFSGSRVGAYPGGGAILNQSTTNISNSTFYNNMALGGYGGSILNLSGTLNVTNSTFYYGYADNYGGAIAAGNGTTTITNSTFSANLSKLGGGGIHSEVGLLSIYNSLFTGNTGGTSTCHQISGTFSGDHNIADDSSCNAIGTQSASILSGSYGMYEGQTQTIPLLPGSAAIDAGNDTYCPTTDQRGKGRVGTCDIGAFESQGFTLSSPTGSNQFALVNTAFSTPLGLDISANHAAEPVNGGLVTFTAPASGASTNPAVNTASVNSGKVSLSVTANGTGGAYSVAATAAGASGSPQYGLVNVNKPTVTTKPVTARTNSGATLNGTINPNDNDATITFEYGLTTAYGTSVSATPDTISGSTETAVSTTLNGLSTNTTYHYRVSATNVGGVIRGADVTFTTLGTQPTLQASGVTFSAVATTSMTVSWTAGSGTNSLVLVKLGSAVDADPVGGTSYTANAIFTWGSQIGSGNYVVYNGTGTSFTLSALTRGRTYHVTVYTFNGSGGKENYLTTTPATGSQTTLAAPPATQASGVTFSAINDTSTTVSWRGGSGSNSLVLVKLGSAVDSAPLSGTSYTANTAFGLGSQIGSGNYVAYNGTGRSFTLSGLTGGSTYHVAVYTFNGSGGAENYLTTLPATGNCTTMATLPSEQASGVTISALADTSMTVNWTAGSGTNSLVLVKSGSAVNSSPTDGSAYTANASFGSGEQIGTGNYVVYNGTGTAVNLTGLTSSTVYHIAVYTFNGSGSITRYLTTSPATGSHTTLVAPPATQANNPVFSNVFNFSMTVSWAAGSGTNSLVLVKSGAAVDSAPLNGSVYTANATFGAGAQVGSGNYVAYNGTNTSVTLTGLTQGTPYHVTVFTFNGTGGTTNYLTTSPATGSQTTTTCGNVATVTNANDSGAGSLRQTIVDLCTGGTINFNGDYTITIASAIGIARDMTITGAGHSVTINGNHTTRVLSIGGGTVTLNHLTIANGAATNSTGGGGIYMAGGTLNVNDSTFSGNSAVSVGGGALEVGAGTANITNSTFSGNSAISGGYGGAIGSNASATLNITHSTFSNNSSASGGGAISANGTVKIINSSITNNSAGSGSGSGIFLQSVTSFKIYNSIIANNSNTNCYSYSGGLSGANNLSNDSSCNAAGSQSTVILLGSLGNYGGSTLTIPLLPGSAAIDAGDPAYCTSGSDQRGLAYAGTCDIGAFESQGFTLGSLTGNDQNTPINTAFSTPLGLTVTANNPVEPVNGGKITYSAPGSGASAAISGSPATISSAKASVTATANGTPGSYTVAAGAAGITTGATFNLTNAKTSTSTDLTSAPNPSTYGDPITLTATVSPSAASGTVAFKNGGANIPGCEAQALSSGQATCQVSFALLGEHILTADYDGDDNYNASVSGSLTQVITRANTTITLGSSLNPSELYQNVTFTASISPATASGTVVFKEGGVTISTCAAQMLSGGQASCTISFETLEVHTITAEYSGDDHYNSSVSGTEAQMVHRLTTTTTLASSLNPAGFGETVTFTATITPSIAGGTVTFKTNDENISACNDLPLSGGQATCATNTLPVGAHRISAEYSGDTIHNVSTGVLSPDQQVGCRTAITVTNSDSLGEGSLYDAVANICPDGKITFTGDFTIRPFDTLTIDKNMTIDGTGHAVTVSGDQNEDGNGDRRVFYINTGVSFHLNQVTITHGKADNGAGLYNAGITQVTNSTITHNTAESKGGGIYNTGTLTATDNLFSANSASFGGGGIFNLSGSAALTNILFENNAAPFGGGMYNESSSPALTDVTFNANQATEGGGVYNFSSPSVLNNVTFNANTAPGYGGGMSNLASSPLLTNVTFSANSAGYGGGMRNENGSSPTLTNVTLNGNSASEGGAMYNAQASNPQVGNSILWGNSGGEIANTDSTPIISDSIVQGGYVDGTGILTADPQFGPLGNHGGLTQTLPLKFNSSAIDGGNPATCAALDQRGQTRNDWACDLGAYELKLTDSTIVQRPVSAGIVTFGPTLVKMEITEPGALSSASVAYHAGPYAHTTGSAGAAGVGWGPYYTLSGQDAGGTTITSGFLLTLSLPHSGLISPNVCKYTGLSGTGWDCGATGSSTTFAWRAGVNSFSDWAVGNNVGPTSVALFSLSAHNSTSSTLPIFASLCAGLVLCARLLRCRRSKRPTRPCLPPSL